MRKQENEKVNPPLTFFDEARAINEEVWAREGAEYEKVLRAIDQIDELLHRPNVSDVDRSYALEIAKSLRRLEINSRPGLPRVTPLLSFHEEVRAIEKEVWAGEGADYEKVLRAIDQIDELLHRPNVSADDRSEAFDAMDTLGRLERNLRSSLKQRSAKAVR